MKKYNVAIMGATGAVGTEFLSILEERQFPIAELRLLASARSKGKKLKFKGQDIVVQELTHDSFQGIDICLASAGGALSKEFAPSAVKAGAVVVDNTSYFRMHADVPLVIPEVNPGDIAWHKGIIANPNCSTIIMALAVYPLHKAFGVKRAVISTYQAASGAGATAMEELILETKAKLEGQPFEATVIKQPYAFNVFPHNAGMNDCGYNDEEIKMSKEAKKIFHEPDFKATATCVRVPVMRAHSESINLEFERPYELEKAYEILKNAPGVTIWEDRPANRWATPLMVSGQDNVFVGRLRRDTTVSSGLELWVVGDQVRKGAALNAVQIAELLIKGK